tara:strand:- start:5030 stop:5962 length:933 start_codon:yes stop_codon:yes gene_type:complete
VAQEILEEIGGTLSFYPQVHGLDTDSSSHPISSVTCAIFKPSSSTAFATGTATIDSSSFTLQSSATNDLDTIVLSSATGIVIGQQYLFKHQHGGSNTWWHQVVRVAHINGVTVQLESPLLDTPYTGDELMGLECTFAISAANAADRAMNYRCEWTVVPLTGDKQKHQSLFHVVRTQFDDPITPEEVLRYAESNLAGATLTWDSGRPMELAESSSNLVRKELHASGTYPHLVGESRSFKTAGLYALKHELAMLGHVPPGFDPGIYLQTIRESLKSEIRMTLSSLTWIDKDDDGVVDNNEKPGPYSVRAVRR